MKNHIDWDLLLNYLDGECTEAEVKQVIEWAATDEENKAELDLLKTIWTSQSIELPKPDVEKALQNVKSKIDSLSYSEKNQPEQTYSVIGKIRKANLIDLVFSPRFLKMAAALAVFIITVIFISRIMDDSTSREITVSNKVIEETTLPDGTKVTLDSGSKLKYSEDFGNKNREVFLSGEGYFEVVPDKSNQFIIHTNSAKISVLGTKFNIRAWGENNKNTVTVVEGEVLFGNEDSELSSDVIIRKGQMSFIENGLVSNPENVDVDSKLSWLNREMRFESTKLKEVLQQLERWYDVEFTLSDHSYEENIITVYIENKPLEEIVELISLIMKFNYQKEGNKIRFTPEE